VIPTLESRLAQMAAISSLCNRLSTYNLLITRQKTIVVGSAISLWDLPSDAT